MMSEHILKLKLDDLAVVRVTCKKCKTCVELPIDMVASRFRSGECAHCNELLFPNDSRLLGQVTQAILELMKYDDKLAVEFVVPIKGE